MNGYGLLRKPLLYSNRRRPLIKRMENDSGRKANLKRITITKPADRIEKGYCFRMTIIAAAILSLYVLRNFILIGDIAIMYLQQCQYSLKFHFCYRINAGLLINIGSSCFLFVLCVIYHRNDSVTT